MFLKDVDDSFVKINHGAGGIGDALLGLCVTAGLKAEGKKIAYAVSPYSIPFIRLFTGYDVLCEHIHDRCEAGFWPSDDLQINDGYHGECKSKAAVNSRFERYAYNVGYRGKPVLPRLRKPLPASRFPGHVVLCPYSSWMNRQWSINSWVTLERLLLEAGYKVVILGTQASDLFRSPQVVNETPANVTAVLNEADMVIGTDSGMAHLAGILGRPTIVLCGQTTVPAVFGAYPNVIGINGKLDCGGCWWQKPYHSERCDPCCPNLQSIAPADVLKEVDNQLLVKYSDHKACIGPEKLPVLRDCVMETKSLHGDLAEFGVWKGGTARLIRHFDNKSPLHLFDTFEGIPETDTFEGGHVQGDFDDTSLAEVQALVPDARFYVGKFPLEVEVPDVQYKFAHVDFDTYQSTLAACTYLKDRMVPGGIIVFDDYGWGACRGVASAIAEVFPGRHLDRPTINQAVLRT